MQRFALFMLFALQLSRKFDPFDAARLSLRLLLSCQFCLDFPHRLSIASNGFVFVSLESLLKIFFVHHVEESLEKQMR